MKKKEQIKQERLIDPQKRDNYLRSMTNFSEQITTSLREHPIEHTCDKKDFCEACSLGQQAADLADEGIGIEGIDF